MLGERIKAARKAKNLTLAKLGERVGLTHSALSKIENNLTESSRRALIALARELNDNFGEEWLDKYLGEDTNRKEMLENMSVEDFVSLKFDNLHPRRSKERIRMLAQMLDEELKKE